MESFPLGKKERSSILKRKGFRFSTLAVALIAIAGVWWFWPKGERAGEMPPLRAKQQIKEVTPAAATKAKPTAVAEERKPLPEKWDDSFATNHELRLHFSKVIEVRTNAFGLITERYVMPNGKTWRIVRDPPPPFDNLCDNTIAMALSVRAGAPIPPVPGLDSANLDQEFANSMATPIKILDTDSPGRAAMKMAVKGAKDEIIRMIKAGDTRSVGEILRDYIDSNNHAVDMQAEALRTVEKIRQESGDEQADAYLDKVNEKLSSFGIEPIKRQTRNGSRKEIQQ